MPAIHAPEPSSGCLRGAHSTPFQAEGGPTVKAMTKTWLIIGTLVQGKARLLLAQVDAHRELSSLAHADAKAAA